MTHDEKRGSVWREFLATSISGVAFGGTNTLVGHPLDTIKTKMQAQSDHMGKTSLLESIKMVYRADGLTGYYRGWIPNFLGSIFFRSIQFSTFESAMTYWETSDSMKQPIPGTGGIQWRVLFSGLISGSSRAIVESPFQYSKTRR